MVEKLIVGRLLDFSRPLWPAGAPPPAQNPSVFVTQPQQFLNIAESTWSPFKRTSNVVAGQHAAKAHRTFGWLTWLPGSISEVQMGGSDVLTGPMSGCDLVLYRRGGLVYAGHLGTDVGADVANTSVKTLWNNFATAHAADVIGGFNPFIAVNGWVPARTGDDALGPPTYYGVYSTAHRFYTLVLYAQKVSSADTRPHATLKRIAGLRQITSKSLHDLQNL